MRTRLFGLLGRRSLAPGTGLLIRPSSGVHTWCMTFPIDIVALDRQCSIVGLWRAVGPWRIRGLSLRTASVLELAAGEIDKSSSAIGDCLQLLPDALAAGMDDSMTVRSGPVLDRTADLDERGKLARGSKR